MATGLTLLVWLAAASFAFAQEPATRAEADRQRREEKSRNAQPYKPGGFERAMHFVEERAIFILGREGLYPKLGSLTTGSGFAYGAGYRDRDLLNNKGTRGSLGRDEHPPVLGDRGAAHVSEAGAQAPASSRRGPRTATIRRRISSASAPTRLAPTQTSYAIQSDLFGGRAGVRPVPDRAGGRRRSSI